MPIFRYPGPLWRPVSWFGYVSMFLSVVIWGPLIVCAVLLGASRQLQTKLLRMWFQHVSRNCFGIRYAVRGAENADASKPSLIVCNHQSLYDIPAAYAVFGGDVRMMAKAELFRIPGFGHAMRNTEFIPVERESRSSSRKAADAIRERILSGLHIWVAPEGTRSADGTIGPFKKGSFAIAIQNGIDIQPLLIIDSKDACPKGSIVPRIGAVIHAVALPRISTKDWKLEDRAQLAEKIRGLLVEAMAKHAEDVDPRDPFRGWKFASPTQPAGA